MANHAFGIRARHSNSIIRKMATEVSYEDVGTEEDPEGTLCDTRDEGALPLAEELAKSSDDEYRFEFHFRNFAYKTLYMNVQHAGCGGTPWHENRPRCWRNKIGYCPQGLSGGGAVYAPSGYVINWGLWWDVIKDGLQLIWDVGMLFVPGPQGKPDYIPDPPKDKDDGLEDALGIFGDVFALTSDTIAAIKGDEQMTQEEYDQMIAKGQAAVGDSAASVGITEDQVYWLAEQMQLGDKWAFCAGNAYAKYIRDNNSESNSNHGWSVFRSNENGSKCKHALKRAKACFIHKGHLIYPVSYPGEDNDWIDSHLWEYPPCC